MKRVLIFIFILILGVAVAFQMGGKVQTDPNDLTLAEAAFRVRTEKTVDATSFLVGSFLRDDGNKFFFDGHGAMTQYSVNLTQTVGTYSLTEAEDGAAVVRMDLGGGPALYNFKLTSPEGVFTLTDKANVGHTYTLVE